MINSVILGGPNASHRPSSLRHDPLAVASHLVTRDPSDRPTEHLRPHVPVAREAVVTSEVVDPLWVEHLEDQVRSLKGFVSLATLLALAGVGLSLYLLLRADGDRPDASRERVARLDGRIDRLEGRVGRASDEPMCHASRTSSRARRTPRASKR